MPRASFTVGLLTGLVCAMAAFVAPPPPRPRPAPPAPPPLAAGRYRLAGTVRLDTCGVAVRPWPDRWSVEPGALVVGERRLPGRAERGVAVYEGVREDAGACLAAAWVVKLAPRGAGFAGTAALEVAAAGAACTPPPGVPCRRTAEITGYPEP